MINMLFLDDVRDIDKQNFPHFNFKQTSNYLI